MLWPKIHLSNFILKLKEILSISFFLWLFFHAKNVYRPFQIESTAFEFLESREIQSHLGGGEIYSENSSINPIPIELRWTRARETQKSVIFLFWACHHRWNGLKNKRHTKFTMKLKEDVKERKKTIERATHDHIERIAHRFFAWRKKKYISLYCTHSVLAQLI